MTFVGTFKCVAENNEEGIWLLMVCSCVRPCVCVCVCVCVLCVCVCVCCVCVFIVCMNM